MAQIYLAINMGGSCVDEWSLERYDTPYEALQAVDNGETYGREWKMLKEMDWTEIEENSMKCKKCGSESLDMVRAGPHCKLICCDCLAFQRFLSKVDAKTFVSLKEKKVLR